MNYQTTYYYGSRDAARQLARQAAEIAGGSTYTETEGYWQGLVEDGATVVVLHDGGIVSSSLNALARQAASDFGEEAVLRVTVATLNAVELTAHNYEDRPTRDIYDVMGPDTSYLDSLRSHHLDGGGSVGTTPDMFELYDEGEPTSASGLHEPQAL